MDSHWIYGMKYHVSLSNLTFRKILMVVNFMYCM